MATNAEVAAVESRLEIPFALSAAAPSGTAAACEPLAQPSFLQARLFLDPFAEPRQRGTFDARDMHLAAPDHGCDL